MTLLIETKQGFDESSFTLDTVAEGGSVKYILRYGKGFSPHILGDIALALMDTGNGIEMVYNKSDTSIKLDYAVADYLHTLLDLYISNGGTKEITAYMRSDQEVELERVKRLLGEARSINNELRKALDSACNLGEG